MHTRIFFNAKARRRKDAKENMNERWLQNLKVVYGFALAFIALTILSSSFIMQL